jgi:hypothetical protein
VKRKRKWGQDEKGWGEKGGRMQRERIGGIRLSPTGCNSLLRGMSF